MVHLPIVGVSVLSATVAVAVAAQQRAVGRLRVYDCATTTHSWLMRGDLPKRHRTYQA